MASDGHFRRCFMATVAICFCSYFTVINFTLCNNLTSIGMKWVSNITKFQPTSFYWSFYYSTLPFGAFLGCFPSSIVAENVGRKYGLLLACPISIIGSITTTIFIHFNNFYLALVGRLLLGIATGLSRTMATLWIAESAPTEKRGFFLSFEGTLYYLGGLVAYVVSLPDLLGTDDRWAYSFLLSAGLQFLLFPYLLYLPESPRHIYFNFRDSQDKLHQSIQFYHGSANLNSTLEELAIESDQQTFAKLSLCEILKNNRLRCFFLLSILIFGTLFFGGISSALTYSTSMLEAGGMSHYVATHITTSMMLIKFPLLFFPLVMEKIGRRPLCILSNAGCGLIASSLVVIYLVDEKSEIVGWSIAALLVIYTYFQQIHEVTALTVAAEMLSQQSRSKGLVIGNLCLSVIGSLLTFAFLPMAHQFSMVWALGPYAIVPLLLAVIVWWALPETRMRSFQEIFGGNSDENQSQQLLLGSSNSLPDNSDNDRLLLRRWSV